MGKFKNLKDDKEVKTHKDALKHPGGRPKLVDNKRKKERIFINFTTQEKEKLKSLANEEGIPLATFIRKILKEQKII